MESKFFIIEGIEYELYKDASEDWCVSISVYGEETESYNCGTLENAYNFILSRYETE